MATRQATVDYIVDQLAKAGVVSARKMFGEYGLYCDGKVVALICDDRMFLKPTDAGKAFVGVFAEGFAYPGAKPSLLIDEGNWDDADWLSELVRITWAALPQPKEKAPKTGRPAKRGGASGGGAV